MTDDQIDEQLDQLMPARRRAMHLIAEKMVRKMKREGYPVTPLPVDHLPS